ncbi:hypothetical protein ACFPT7_17485 [Acidicapsa dinghuensis]|uniref:Uncharacterized protein n=1 Tax=Acidicapsa dinghuensis TaxID=2218256 RepID=A0ABW1EMB3_9BACT|nr:hypothetical protein [Acidicapsa dinghuensis]
MAASEPIGAADGGTLHCGGVEEDAEGRGSDPVGETGFGTLEAGGTFSQGEKEDAAGCVEDGTCDGAGAEGWAENGRNADPVYGGPDDGPAGCCIGVCGTEAGVAAGAGSGTGSYGGMMRPLDDVEFVEAPGP